MDYTAIIIAALASLPGIFALVTQMRKEHREAKIAESKTEIDTLEITQQSVAVLLDPLNKRIATLEQLGEDCKKRVSEFEGLIGVKEARIKELENLVSEKDKRITEMQKEIDELRERISVLEKNGGTKP